MELNIATVTPDRPGREFFRPICEHYIERQTLQPDFSIFVDWEGDGSSDLILRCMHGVAEALDMGADFILFIENDDWYHPRYVEFMAEAFIANDMPHAVGIDNSTYFHLHSYRLHEQAHPGRASLCATGLSRAFFQYFNWNMATEPFLDLAVWKQAKTKAFISDRLVVGLKHGIGYAGGRGHLPTFGKPSSWDWLVDAIGEDIKYYQ